MASFAAYESRRSEDTQIWDSLKVAIATSPAFQRWQMERPVDECGHDSFVPLQEFSLDYRVRRYLRETLETLAY